MSSGSPGCLFIVISHLWSRPTGLTWSYGPPPDCKGPGVYGGALGMSSEQHACLLHNSMLSLSRTGRALCLPQWGRQMSICVLTSRLDWARRPTRQNPELKFSQNSVSKFIHRLQEWTYSYVDSGCLLEFFCNWAAAYKLRVSVSPPSILVNKIESAVSSLTWHFVG